MRPGRSRELARNPAESSTEVSGVPVSDREFVDGGADLVSKRRSEAEDGVDGVVAETG